MMFFDSPYNHSTVGCGVIAVDDRVDRIKGIETFLKRS